MKNWKTLAVGILGGVLLGVNRSMNLGIDESHINYVTLLMLSIFAKDSDTTGIGSSATKLDDTYSHNIHSD